ncbi:hypothetical protein PUN28_001072 [Cardiocondyla obscurior]|uniref:Uncharacterized protein n=1 Tax=Cardiocondyla obscurior TaxID=286306 RepID=A0AAW2H2R8_9HYME
MYMFDAHRIFVHLRILAISHCDIAVSHLISSSLLPHSVPPYPNSTTSSFPNSRVPSCLISSSRHFPEPEAPGCSFLSESEDEPTPVSSNQSRASLFHRRPNQTFGENRVLFIFYLFLLIISYTTFYYFTG